MAVCRMKWFRVGDEKRKSEDMSATRRAESCHSWQWSVHEECTRNHVTIAQCDDLGVRYLRCKQAWEPVIGDLAWTIRRC